MFFEAFINQIIILLIKLIHYKLSKSILANFLVSTKNGFFLVGWGA
jgi:hypothetical protein